MLERILANTRMVLGLSYGGVPCRIWTGTPNIRGYPYMSVRKPGQKHPGKVLAHRVACAIQNGPPPFAGAEAMHRCNVFMCVEGTHLKWGTGSENMKYWHATGGMVGGDETTGGGDW